MTKDQLIEICENQKGASASFPFGEDVLVYKVGGKMFALISIKDEPWRINLKVPTEQIETLIDTYQGVTEGYHMNKKHWISIWLDGSLPYQEFKSLIEQSYQLVFSGLSKKVRSSISN